MLKYVPIILFCAVHLTLIITFSIALTLKHVTYFMPYISDSGTFPPESCIFGMVLNLGAALISFIMYVRFLQIKEILAKHNFQRKSHKFNKLSLCVGLIACFGCSIVANFQETTMLVPHWIGAILLFLFGSLYQVSQSQIYFEIYPIIGNRKVNILRAILAVIASVSVMIFIIFGAIAGRNFTGTDVTKWRIEDGGFEMHLVSSTSEWICAFCTMSFLLCFSLDFKKITLKEPEIFVEYNTPVAINEQTL